MMRKSKAAKVRSFTGKARSQSVSIAALDLNAHGLDGAARVRVDADKVVAFVFRWRLVSENISSHKVADDEKVRTPSETTGRRRASSLLICNLMAPAMFFEAADVAGDDVVLADS